MFVIARTGIDGRVVVMTHDSSPIRSGWVMLQTVMQDETIMPRVVIYKNLITVKAVVSSLNEIAEFGIDDLYAMELPLSKFKQLQLGRTCDEMIDI